MADKQLIESFLQDLDARLAPIGRSRRRRILAEARDHLVDASDRDGVAVAIERFGDPATIAREHLNAAAAPAARGAVLVLGVAGAFFAATFVLTSPATLGVLPAGPWPGDVPPSYLGWKADVAGALVLAAGALGLAALWLLGRGRHRAAAGRTLVLRLVTAGTWSFVAGCVVEAMFLVERSQAVAGPPAPLVVGGVCAAYLACAAAAAAVAERARRLVRAGTAV